ncbi:hypothetical protein AOL_s00043g114 [Orbilia oligospora ATCC 24927]|uniref:ATP-dependent RNA helicase n=1 Tax=Arthrobotrys oligospora (strain ATCC 24927 / CBS 115.81 / DSM 1491) TaxID=756982 RepID=G1X341_ARTOA|nr:hypothetical protein AOL_s00043g114 [Orbilia oligospora ATCC 24927]EGX52325.1 hypothetical protein AOL_s00043g114 [Orbilia oligospora ATCC 24927]
MLRLNSRLLGKQATSPTNYICQRCFQSARWSSSPSSPLRNPLCSRDYHTTAASLQRQRYEQRGGGKGYGGERQGGKSYDRGDGWGHRGGQPRRPQNRRYDERDEADAYISKKRYGGPRKYKPAEDEYPDEVSDGVEFEQSRYQIDGGVVGRAAQENLPDLQAIMANARDADFSRKLHKLQREEAEKRDPAQRILDNLVKPTTFEESSLRPVVKKALAKAYPNIKSLSFTQRNMLVLLQEGYSLCATGPAASGKSFITTLWLLQLARSLSVVTKPDGTSKKVPSTTGIIFVPTIDLMKQYMDTLDNLVGALTQSGQSAPPKDTIFQGFTRLSDEVGENEQIERLKKNPSPHIIVTTPTRFLDILNDPQSKNYVNLDNVKVIVADEVDAMVNQRPPPKALGDMIQQKRIRQEARWAKPTPLETCVDFLIARRELLAHQQEQTPDPIQFCCISPNLSPILRSKLVYSKNWIGFSKTDSKANQMVNLGIQDFSKLFDHEKIGPIVRLPERIKHYALSVDINTGLMRDIPMFKQDPLIRSSDEQAEIEKYINVLKIHEDPRSDLMSKEALAVEAAQENLLKEEEGSIDKYKYPTGIVGGNLEVRDVITELANDFRHTSIPKKIVVEILDVLLKRDNYPERVLVFLTPTASRAQYIEALENAGFNAEVLRADTCAAKNIPLGRSDLPGPPPSADGRVRTKADTTIWVTSGVAARGMDTPHFTHAYIMAPTTGYQRYAQMAGRVARYPFQNEKGKFVEPKGQVTTIFLEETVGDHRYAPMIDGVIQVDSPVEGLAWRRIYRMYGVCGATLGRYFGPGEESGVMLRTVDTHTARFPGMEDELPWEDGTNTSSEAPKLPEEVAEEDAAFEFLPFEGGASHDTAQAPTEQDNVRSTEVEAEPEYEDSFEPITLKQDDSSSTPANTEPVASEGQESITESETSAVEEPSPEEEKIESETREDENDPEDSPSIYEPLELKDGPYFIPEDAPDPEHPIRAHTESTAIPPELSGVEDTPLELGEGITEEEGKEFQEAQDDIFSAFLELNSIQEKIRQAQEEQEGIESSDESDESDDSDSSDSSDSDDEFVELADGEIDDVEVHVTPATKKPEDGN